MRPGGADLRLVAPAIAAWIAAGLLLARPGAGWWCSGLAGAAAGVLALCALAAARRPRWAGALVVVLAAVGLVAAAVALAGAARHPHALDRVAAGRSVSIDATVTSTVSTASSSPFGGGERVAFHVTASAVDVGQRRIAGRMPGLVYAQARSPEPRIGEQVRVTGTLRASPSADDVAFMVFSGAWMKTGGAPFRLAWADGLRARFGAAADALPGDGGALLPGLAIGDDSRVPDDLDGAMKASSLSHLTAVSGSNIAVIVAGLIALTAALGLPRLWRIGIALLGLAGFVVLVTPGASVLRAAVMASVVVLGTALGRPGRALPALCLAVLILLVADPWLARDYGFALSVLATAALLLLAPPLAERMARWMPRWLAVGLSVPLAAQLACQPVLVLLNPTVPLYGVVANVLAEPAAPIATVLGLIGCLALPVSPPLAAPLLRLAWAPAAWIAGIARTSVALPAAALPWPGGVAGLLSAAVLTGAVVLIAVRPASARGRVVRGALGAASALVLVVATALQAGPAIVARAEMPRDWTVGMCDIGQGDGIVLKSGDQYGVIDTGPDPKPMAACLHELGIRRVSLLVLTHYDADHVGGLDALLDLTGTAVVGTPPDGDASAARDVAELRQHGVAVHLGTRGDEGALGALRWRVLWPDGAHPDMATSNEGGVTLLVEGAGVRMLFLADLDEKAQDAVIRDGGLPRVDIVKVAHHGSADQSAKLYGLVGARLGLISCGLGNDYGHPTAKLLGLLHAAGTQVARTDLEGMVLVTVRDGELGLWTRKHVAEAALWKPAKR